MLAEQQQEKSGLRRDRDWSRKYLVLYLPGAQQTTRVEKCRRKRFRHVDRSYLAQRKLFSTTWHAARDRSEERLQEFADRARRTEHGANGHADRSFTSACRPHSIDCDLSRGRTSVQSNIPATRYFRCADLFSSQLCPLVTQLSLQVESARCELAWCLIGSQIFLVCIINGGIAQN